MAYTIIRSDGTILTTIQDGTINTTSTSLGLPGRNKAGYGQTLDTNMVKMLENFASNDVPAHPLRGQLWYDTNSSPGVLRVCPSDGTLIAADWPALASTSTTGNTVVPNLTATGNIDGNNLSITHAISSATITVANATVSSNLIAVGANITTANIGTLYTRTINADSTSTLGTMTGKWTVNGTGNALTVSGNLAFDSSVHGIKCGKYMNADGTDFVPTGTYNDSNVSAYLTDTDDMTGFRGEIFPSSVTTGNLIGSGSGSGSIQGIWTLASGAKIQATYSADLAERYAADAEYPVGTVLEIGGEFEVTAVKEELSSEIFGVVSDSYAYLLNGAAGDDKTHPPVALVGRVNVNVVGQVKKGQRLVSAGNGVARAATLEELTPFNTIGRALENKTTDGAGVVLAAVSIK
jgi:hypothetical protein